MIRASRPSAWVAGGFVRVTARWSWTNRQGRLSPSVAGGGGDFSGSHDDLSDVSSGDHHTRPSAGDGLSDTGDTFSVSTGSGIEHDGSGNVQVDRSEVFVRQVNISGVEIASGETHLALRKRIPAGKTFSVWELGVMTPSGGSAGSSASLEVDFLDRLASISSTSAHDEGSPMMEVSPSSGEDVEIRVENTGSSSVQRTGYVLYSME